MLWNDAEVREAFQEALTCYDECVDGVPKWFTDLDLGLDLDLDMDLCLDNLPL